MINQRPTKILTTAYTTTDADIGYRLICNSASDFTITLHSPTGRYNFELEIDNIGAGIVTCNSMQIKQNTHAHLGCTGAVWTLVLGGGAMTKAEIEAVLTGELTSHSHASLVTKANIEAVLTGEISSHTHAGGGTGDSQMDGGTATSNYGGTMVVDGGAA